MTVPSTGWSGPCSQPAHKVVVVGAGPVGVLSAIYAASQGHQVEVFELRRDPRLMSAIEHKSGQSINLTLSERGLHALAASGRPKIYRDVLARSTPLSARIVHTRDSRLGPRQKRKPYGRDGQALRCISREDLQDILLHALHGMENATVVFERRLVSVDFSRRVARFEDARHASRVEERRYSLLIGADGVHSTVRDEMRRSRLVDDVVREDLDCMWTEITIPATPLHGGCPLAPDALHVWPAGEGMLVAMPRRGDGGGGFIGTLFAPQATFRCLDRGSDDDIAAALEGAHPGLGGLVGRTELVRQFRANRRRALCAVRCTPHHADAGDGAAAAVLVGDAAHAIVPFYGQGTNAGFESVRLLWGLVGRSGGPATPSAALRAYSALRVPDAHCIADLAMSHRGELGYSDAVSGFWAVMREWSSAALGALLPSLCSETEYALVSFTNMRYSEVRRSVRRRRAVAGLRASGLLLSVWILVYAVITVAADT